MKRTVHPSISRRLTLDRMGSTDQYLIKYMYKDGTSGHITRIKCDATKWISKATTTPDSPDTP